MVTLCLKGLQWCFSPLTHCKCKHWASHLYLWSKLCDKDCETGSHDCLAWIIKWWRYRENCTKKKKTPRQNMHCSCTRWYSSWIPVCITNRLPPSSCWLQNDAFLYVTVIAFILLILLCNLLVFIMVLIQIRQMRANKPSADSCMSLRDLRTVASLTVLLGLTWAMGFFSFEANRVVLMYLFCIFNSLQGKYENIRYRRASHFQHICNSLS